ncbi:acyl-CoA thioesterase [Patulibacter minatonensis]|uniref:acyl-CoA thioesterase n=1 Tax=Patulibacter minatonensis TaxID=298163 RepID=UPI00047D5796|nr:thioesterase family protein [Patulibacter minatonensis]
MSDTVAGPGGAFPTALTDAPPPWAPPAADVASGPIELPVRVRFLECDPQGVLAHPRYLDLFDDTYMRLNTTRLGGFAAMMRGGIETLVVKTEVDFAKSARAEEELVVVLDLERLGRSSVTLRYRALGRDDGELRAQARTTYVCAHVGEGRSVAFPRWMRERYLGLGGPGSAPT